MFEIRNIKTDEILVDNLTYDELECVYDDYEAFYGDDIYAFYNDAPVPKKKHVSRELEYKRSWLHYYDELQAMGNI